MATCIYSFLDLPPFAKAMRRGMRRIYICGFAKGVRQGCAPAKGEEGGSGALENDFLIYFNKKP
jgi:hypothetical protein